MSERYHNMPYDDVPRVCILCGDNERQPNSHYCPQCQRDYADIIAALENDAETKRVMLELADDMRFNRRKEFGIFGEQRGDLTPEELQEHDAENITEWIEAALADRNPPLESGRREINIENPASFDDLLDLINDLAGELRGEYLFDDATPEWLLDEMVKSAQRPFSLN